MTSVSGRDGVTVLVEADPSHHAARRQGGGEVAATLRDLVPRLQVEVWFDGPVATSYPVQGKAQVVVIVR